MMGGLFMSTSLAIIGCANLWFMVYVFHRSMMKQKISRLRHRYLGHDIKPRVFRNNDKKIFFYEWLTRWFLRRGSVSVRLMRSIRRCLRVIKMGFMIINSGLSSWLPVIWITACLREIWRYFYYY